MSNVRRVNGEKRVKTLADVKREALKQAKKAAEADKAFAARMQADITNELKGIKTQQQLTNIQEMVSTYGSSKNRAEFDKLQKTFRKEARALIDMELATMKSKAQLESIRSMVELNGSEAQKAKFAEFDSYYKKPTWAKYAKLHDFEYTAPTSGVGEADRIAEQIISNNNLKQMEEEARKADKAAAQTRKALAASSQMDEFLAEGDKLIAQGKEIQVQNQKPRRMTWAEYARQHGTSYTPPTSGVGEADRIAEQIISNNNLKQMEEEARKADKAAAQTRKALAASSQMDEFLAEGDKLIAQGKQSQPEIKVIGGKDVGRLRPSEPAEAVEIIEGGEKGKHAARDFSKLTKVLKRGTLGLLGLGAAALLYFGFKKCCNTPINTAPDSNIKKQKPIDTPANKVVIPTIIPNPTDTVENKKDSSAVIVPIDSTRVVTPVPNDTVDTNAVAKIIPIEDKTESSKENKDSNKTKTEELETYIPKKGEYWASILKARYNTDDATALAMSHRIKDMIYDDSLAAKQSPIMYLPKVWNFNGKTYYYNDGSNAKKAETTGNVKTVMGKMSPDLKYN